MSRTGQPSFVLDSAVAMALSAGNPDALVRVRRLTHPARPFVALDDFDQTLTQTGRLLLQTAEEVHLITGSGQVHTQTGVFRDSFPPDLPAGPVTTSLSDLSPLRRLLTFGKGRMRVLRLDFPDDEGLAHSHADFIFMDRTAGTPVAIVLLAGKRGKEGAMAALRNRILACGGVPLAVERLVAQLFPGRAPYSARPAPAFGTEASAFEAANSIIAACIPIAQANEAGIIADLDTEFLHDYRVALRKVRSVLSLCHEVYSPDQTAALKERLLALMAPTSRLRDLDVQLLDHAGLRARLPESLHGGLDIRHALLLRDRKAAHRALATHLRHPETRAEIAALAGLFATPETLQPGPNANVRALDFARILIWKRYRKICRISATLGPHTTDAEVHALRIDCKKLRYLMELFGPLFPQTRLGPLVNPLKTLQDSLGLVNDCAVQQAQVHLFMTGAARKVGPDMPEVAQSMGALTMLLHQRQTRERSRTADRLARFTDRKTRRAFRGLFLETGSTAQD
jgi:CHAD domain-containing protein